jgi:hypothetical protein
MKHKDSFLVRRERPMRSSGCTCATAMWRESRQWAEGGRSGENFKAASCTDFSGTMPQQTLIWVNSTWPCVPDSA